MADRLETAVTHLRDTQRASQGRVPASPAHDSGSYRDLAPATRLGGAGSRTRQAVTEIQVAPVATPLWEAVCLIRDFRNVRRRPTGFMQGNSKWRRLLCTQRNDWRLWQVAVLFHLRDAFRSGHLWLRHSRRYADLKQALVPAEVATTTPALAVPRLPRDWLTNRMTRMLAGLERLAHAARMGVLAGASVEEGILRTERIAADPPVGADAFILDLYRRLPEAGEPLPHAFE